jgi:hypothetical protein
VPLAYSIGAGLLMWPVLASPSNRVYGLSSDPLGEVWRLAQFRAGQIGLVGNTTTEMANVPSGVALRRSLDVTQAIFDLFASTTVRFVEPVPAYNLLVFAGLAFTGIATYAAARRLGARPLGAAVAGALLVLAPVHMIEAQLHVALSYAAPLPLLLLVGINALRRPCGRRGAYFGAALGVCGYFTAYLLLEAVAIGIGIAAAAAVLALTSGSQRLQLGRAALAAALAALVVLAPLLTVLAARKSEIDAAVGRSDVEAISYSLELDAYRLRDSGVYPGVLATLLAAFALLLPSVPRVVRLGVAMVAVAGLLLSLKANTTVAGIDLPMPSELVQTLVPYWRVFGRLAIVVSLGIAILAAFTIDYIAERSRIGFALACVLAVVASADLMRRPPPAAADLGVPDPIAAVLSDAEGSVAEYPLFGFDNHMIGPYLFRQLRHGRPILNGAIPGTTSADLSAAAGDLGPQARAALVLAGVRHFVANPGSPRPLRREFSLVSSEDGRAVYRVQETPPGVAVAAVRGGYPPERGPDGSSFVWLGARPKLSVVADAAGPVQVTLNAVSHTVTRSVRIASQRFTITAAPTTVIICIRAEPDGTMVVPIESTPPAARLPGGDSRVASIGVFRLTARPLCGPRD